MASLANASICGHTVCRGGTVEGNASLGYLTLRSTNAANQFNAGFGAFALSSTSLSHCCNTGVGYLALCANTSGQQNTGVGAYAGRAITTAYQNVAIGFKALCANSTGHKQVAIGANASIGSTSGTKSIAVGAFSSTGNAACAIAIGAYAQSTGTRSVAIGYGANAYGTQAVAIGNNSNANSCSTSIGASSSATGICAIAIGYSAKAQEDNQITIGYQALNNYGANAIMFGTTSNNVCNCIYVNWTYCSDQNEKTNIQSLAYDFGLPLVKKLRPVKFNWDIREKYVQKCSFEWGQKDDTLIQKEEEYGLIAQELEQALNELNLRFDGLKVRTKRYHITETELIAPLVKSIQQLSNKLDSIKERITILENA